jgi:hypothetical protein
MASVANVEVITCTMGGVGLGFLGSMRVPSPNLPFLITPETIRGTLFSQYD